MTGIKAAIQQPVLSNGRLEAYLVTRHQAFLDGIRKIITHDNKQLTKEALYREKVTLALEMTSGSDWQNPMSRVPDPVSWCNLMRSKDLELIVTFCKRKTLTQNPLD